MATSNGTPPAGCEYPDCGRPVVARGYCDGHYKQYIRRGNSRRGMHPLRPEGPPKVKLPGVHVRRETARKLRAVHRNQYRAVQMVLEAWGDLPGSEPAQG